MHGINLVLAVKMSPTQLYDGNFIPALRSLNQSYCVELNRFELELTEARALGLNVAVDDFGKGYSNLAQIRDIEVDIIKVDKSFVMELELNPVNLAMIKATQLIGEAMDCDIVAEGIETIGQMHILREAGIKMGQGFLYLSVGSSLTLHSRAG